MVLRPVLALGAAWLAVGAAAQNVTFPPRPTAGAVADEAQALSKEDRAEIDRISAQAAAEHGSLIVVAVVKSQKAHNASYLTVEQYARLLFDNWGPGSQTNNKGMLLFVSIELAGVLLAAHFPIGPDDRPEIDDEPHLGEGP